MCKDSLKPPLSTRWCGGLFPYLRAQAGCEAMCGCVKATAGGGTLALGSGLLPGCPARPHLRQGMRACPAGGQWARVALPVSQRCSDRFAMWQMPKGAEVAVALTEMDIFVPRHAFPPHSSLLISAVEPTPPAMAVGPAGEAWAYLPPLGASLTSPLLPLPWCCHFHKSYQLWKAIPVLFFLFALYCIQPVVFLSKGAASPQRRRPRAWLVFAGKDGKLPMEQGAEPSLGEPSGRQWHVRGSSVRKWPSEEWALRDSKACQPMGKRKKQIHSQVPQRGGEMATGTWLWWHRICCNPASPWAAGLEPVKRKDVTWRHSKRICLQSFCFCFLSIWQPVCRWGVLSLQVRWGTPTWGQALAPFSDWRPPQTSFIPRYETLQKKPMSST